MEMSMNERLEELAGMYYDFYKEVHGFRPRWIYNEEGCVYTEAEMEKMLDALSKEAEEVFAAEKKHKEEKLAEVELRLTVLIESGAGDRETAKRWLVQSLGFDSVDLMYGGEKVCWELGLDFKHSKEWDAACKAA
jgi:hypothetical protein